MYQAFELLELLELLGTFSHCLRTLIVAISQMHKLSQTL